MTYLYGDSSDSGLELNYIELLREFLDFGVQVMLSEHRITEAREALEARKRRADGELDRLRSLGASVNSTLERATSPDPKSSTDISIQRLQQATEATLRQASESLRQDIEGQEAQLANTRKRERAGNVRLIETLLLQHDLPDMQSLVDVSINAEGSGYRAQVQSASTLGLDWRMAAEIPSDHRLASVLKVTNLVGDLTISLPEMSGFVRKSMKLKPFRLGQLYLIDFKDNGRLTQMRLRSTPNLVDDTGCDIDVASGSVRVTRVSKGESSETYQLDGENAASVADLCQALSDAATDLAERRNKLLEVSYQGIDLAEIPDPTRLVAAFVDRLGPVVKEISKHSLTDTELVLKRVLANDRREEIFASKPDLLSKLGAVPAKLRAIFAPLGLGDVEQDVGDYEPTQQVFTSAGPDKVVEAVGSTVELSADEPAAHERPSTYAGEEESTNVLDDVEYLEELEVTQSGPPLETASATPPKTKSPAPAVPDAEPPPAYSGEEEPTRKASELFLPPETSQPVPPPKPAPRKQRSPNDFDGSVPNPSSKNNSSPKLSPTPKPIRTVPAAGTSGKPSPRRRTPKGIRVTRNSQAPKASEKLNPARNDRAESVDETNDMTAVDVGALPSLSTTMQGGTESPAKPVPRPPKIAQNKPEDPEQDSIDIALAELEADS